MTPVAFIGQPGEPLPEVPAVMPEAPAEAKPTAVSAPRPDIPPRQSAATVPVAPPPVPVPSQPSRKLISPRARQMAKEHAISYEPISGTGPSGRIIEKDVIKYLEAKKYKELKITPAAKTLARKEGIDILSIEIEAENRRILVEDIEQKIAEKPKEMTKIRQVIAQRLTKSFTSTPHFYVTVAIDMTDLLELRKKLKEENKPYSVTDFILKACATALSEFPAVNSVTDGKTIRWHARVHLGLAVEIKEGLVVPVIRNADTISLAELHERAVALVARARDGKLSPAEMTGSTFTVSNMGMLNIDNFTAIINPGESAILAVASTFPTPVAVKDKIKIRSIMKATLSSDHRLVDGAMAARFINRIKDLLEDVKTWTNMI
jgi:pyruvate dehydrogenase E2 component (dihydrolipoamide acetyltransferase)